jgi:hypothetical protein
MDVSTLRQGIIHSAPGDRIEVSVRGKWQPVPAYRVHDQTVVVTGRWLKIAAIHDEEWLEDEVSNAEECIRELKESHGATGADVFTFSQKVPATAPLYSYPMELESIAVARVGCFKEWWDGLPQMSRKNVRRSERRGVTVRKAQFDDEFVRGIAAIQNECAVRQGRRYPHFGKSFDQVKKDHSSFLDRCDFVGAYFEDRLIGFLKVVYRGHVASLLQLNTMAAHHDKRPANALIAKCVELCSEQGIEFLTYARFNYGNKGDDGLREFKSRTGFEEVLVPRYYVPLTAWGRFCVRQKLYKGLLEILPRPAIQAVVRTRMKWYDLRRRAFQGQAKDEAA